MAEPFSELAAAIPGWIERLDSLAKQVGERQRDLARVASEAKAKATATATESAAAQEKSKTTVSAQTSATAVEEKPAAVQLPAVAAHQYRSRDMILVYYDSYVQSFFEDLVRFLAFSRNQLRKAKLAARMTQLQHSVADMVGNTGNTGNNNNSTDNDPAVVPPPLLYKRTMALRSPAMLATGRPQYRRASGRPVHIEMTATGMPKMTGAGAGGKTTTTPPDMHDMLDRTLEGVQALCEHTAHRFLRDGTCGDGVLMIRKRLMETGSAAARAAKTAKAADEVEKKNA